MKKMKKPFLILLSILLLTGLFPMEISVSAASALTLGRYVAKGCIFRQNAPITIPGKAEAGVKITGSFTDENKNVVSEAETTADGKGKFILTFPGLPGGYSKYTLKVTDGTNTRTITSVLIGEVWMTGGQSNMEYWVNWTPSGYRLTQADLKDTNLRVFKANGGAPGWILGNDVNGIKSVTGVGYYFAKELREALDVPVAIIDTAVGATSIYQWLTKTALLDDPDLLSYASSLSAPIGDQYQKNVSFLEGITVSGMLWYQGETNTSNKPGYYRRALSLLRSSWGDQFGFKSSTMPLIFAHLAPHRYLENPFDTVPYFTDELNAVWMEEPDTTAQITTYDLSIEYKTTTGSIAPIHPTNKDQVGKRMAEAALGLVYEKSDEYTSPVLKSSEVKEGAVYATFDHVGDGLGCKDKELEGFTICGDDKIYVNAKAQIVSEDTVKIWSPLVPSPKSAVYAWAQLNNEANLSSTKDGKIFFGAIPFRTTEETLPHFFRPHDYVYCDEDKIWDSVASEANWAKAWNSVGATVSIDKNNAFSGNGALHVKVKEGGPLTVSPHIPATVSVDHDYSLYGGISMVVKNLGSSKITFTKATFINADGTRVDVPVNKVIEGESTWKTAYVDISANIKSANLSKLKNVNGIDFVFEADEAGDFLIDELLFAPKGAKAPVETEQPIETEAPATETQSVTKATETEKLPENEKNNGWILPVCIAAGVLVLGGIAALVILKKKKK